MYHLAGLPEIGHRERVRFPPPQDADEEGILGQGGNLSPGVLLSAYEQGIFPWYMPGDPILWWSPDPRFVLFFSDFHISRRNQRALAKKQYRISMDQNFEDVISSCAALRKGKTWISDEMISAYCRLHRLGHAHSVEVWEADTLVGGLYGVSSGGMFFGESMFSLCSGASTSALKALVSFLRRQGGLFTDSQVANPHMAGLGGREIPRRHYLQYLDKALKQPAITGWQNYVPIEETVGMEN